MPDTYTASVASGDKLTYDTHTSDGAITQYKVLQNESPANNSYLTVTIYKNEVEDNQSSAGVPRDQLIAATRGSATVIPTQPKGWHVTVETSSAGSLSATLHLAVGSGTARHSWTEDISSTLTLGGSFPIDGVAAGGGS